MSRDTCEACGAPLIWALSRSGRPSPITKDPKPNGNVLLHRDAERRLIAVALPTDLAEQLRALDVPLRLVHFADCPEAARFRRERTTT
jgi:hypothetical protein